MDNPIIYGGVLIGALLAAMTFYKNNNTLLMMVSLAVAGLVVYSHESGKGMRDLEKGIHDSINDPAQEYGKKYETDVYDPSKASKHVK